MVKKYMSCLAVIGVFGAAPLMAVSIQENYEKSATRQHNLSDVVQSITDDLQKAKNKNEIVTVLTNVTKGKYSENNKADYTFVTSEEGTVLGASNSGMIGMNTAFMKEPDENKRGQATLELVKNGGGIFHKQSDDRHTVTYVSPLITLSDGTRVYAGAGSPLPTSSIIHTVSELKKYRKKD